MSPTPIGLGLFVAGRGMPAVVRLVRIGRRAGYRCPDCERAESEPV